MNKDNKLGMGLGALLSKTTDNNNDNKGLQKINISQIQPNPKQPRKNFKDNDLNELATSIKNQGLIQPVVVRELNTNQFEIVAVTKEFIKTNSIDDTIYIFYRKTGKIQISGWTKSSMNCEIFN